MTSIAYDYGFGKRRPSPSSLSAGIFGAGLGGLGGLREQMERLRQQQIASDAGAKFPGFDPAHAGPAIDVMSPSDNYGIPIAAPTGIGNIGRTFDIGMVRPIGHEPRRRHPRRPHIQRPYPEPMGGGGGQAPTLTPQEWKMTITPAGGGGRGGGGGGGIWGGGRGGGPQLGVFGGGLGGRHSLPMQRNAGGIIGLAGGGHMPPYGLADGGEVPMVYANGGYVPAFIFGGLWRGIKKGFKKLIPAAVSFIPGIGPLASAGISALGTKVAGGSWTDALSAGATGYTFDKALNAAKDAWKEGGIKGLSFGDKLENALKAGGGSVSKGQLAAILSAEKASLEEQRESEGLDVGAGGGGGTRVMGGPSAMPQAGQVGTIHGPVTTNTWQRFGLGSQATQPQPAVGRFGGGMVPEYDSLYARRRFGGMVPGYQVGGRFPPFRMGPAQAMPVPAAPPRLPMAPPVAPPMGPPPSMGPPMLPPPPVQPPGMAATMPYAPPAMFPQPAPVAAPPMELPPIIPEAIPPVGDFSAIDEQAKKLAKQAKTRVEDARKAVTKEKGSEEKEIAEIEALQAEQQADEADQVVEQQKLMQEVAEAAPETVAAAPPPVPQAPVAPPPPAAPVVAPPAPMPPAPPVAAPPAPMPVAPPVAPPPAAPPIEPPPPAPVLPPVEAAPPGPGLEEMADVIPDTMAAVPPQMPPMDLPPAGGAPPVPPPAIPPPPMAAPPMAGPPAPPMAPPMPPPGVEPPMGPPSAPTVSGFPGLTRDMLASIPSSIPSPLERERRRAAMAGETPPGGGPQVTPMAGPPPMGPPPPGMDIDDISDVVPETAAAAPLPPPPPPMMGIDPMSMGLGLDMTDEDFDRGGPGETGDPDLASTRIPRGTQRGGGRRGGGRRGGGRGGRRPTTPTQPATTQPPAAPAPPPPPPPSLGLFDERRQPAQTQGPTIFGPGFDPANMPVTAADFRRSGVPGSGATADMLQRMNQRPRVESYAPPIRRAEGGAIDAGLMGQVEAAVRKALMSPNDPGSAEIIQGYIEAFGEEELLKLAEGLAPPTQQAMPPMQVPQQLGRPEMPMQEGGLLTGEGDGMADDVLVTADTGTPEAQPVALSKGEFIVAADVVSGLGNGNTDEGAAILEQMQDEVRMGRTGSPQQPPPLDLQEVLPEPYGEEYA